jgi:hypothetical protein
MCVILYTKIDGKQILAKNRDKIYKPEVEIIHELENGIEIAYIRDKKSGWIEGMNENGVGLVNSTLNMNDDKHIKKTRSGLLKTKKNKIYNSLGEKKISKIFFDLLNPSAKKEYVLEGNTLLHLNNEIFHIENNILNEYVIKKIIHPVVYTNHGINLKDEGYKEGRKGLSSFLRKKIVEEEFKRKMPQNYDELANIMNKNYVNIDPRFHPYRDRALTLKRVKDIKNKNKIISTRGQLILNLTDKELIYYTDINNSKKTVYVNKLPRYYIPKIRVIIKKTEKNLKPTKILTQKYIDELEDKFLTDNTTKKTDINHSSSKKNVKSVKNKTRKRRQS